MEGQSVTSRTFGNPVLYNYCIGDAENIASYLCHSEWKTSKDTGEELPRCAKTFAITRLIIHRNFSRELISTFNLIKSLEMSCINIETN